MPIDPITFVMAIAMVCFATLLLAALKRSTTDPRVLLDEWAYTGRLMLRKEGRTQLALLQKHGEKYRELQRRVKGQKTLIAISLAEEKRFEKIVDKSESESLIGKQREHCIFIVHLQDLKTIG